MRKVVGIKITVKAIQGVSACAVRGVDIIMQEVIDFALVAAGIAMGGVSAGRRMEVSVRIITFRACPCVTFCTIGVDTTIVRQAINLALVAAADGIAMCGVGAGCRMGASVRIITVSASPCVTVCAIGSASHTSVRHIINSAHIAAVYAVGGVVTGS